MKSRILSGLTALVFAATLHAAEPADPFPDLMQLSKREAARVARKQAEADFASGHYRMLVFGLRAAGSEPDQRLKKEGVEVLPIAGCIVSEGILEGARVYNEIMREKLKAKLGRDVFAEGDAASKRASK